MKSFERKLTNAILLTVILTVSLCFAARAEGDLTALYTEKAPSVLTVHGMAEAWSRETGKSVVEKSCCTGLYIDERGYVLTTWHSLNSIDYAEIETAEGERIRAEEIFEDNTLDVAVLRLEKPIEGVKALELGDSGKLIPGMKVVTIGAQDSTFGQTGGVLATGIISALGVDSSKALNFTRAVPLIRTSAVIGFGSSGGALFTEDGELVGMLVLLVDSDGYETEEFLSAAIPASTLDKVADDLIDFGVVQRPRMGIMVYDTDGPEEALKNYPPCGILVSEVEEGSPADEAGLLVYDIITAIDDVRVHTYNEMSLILDELEVGDTIKVTIYRCADPDTGYMIENPQYMDFEITLGKLD